MFFSMKSTDQGQNRSQNQLSTHREIRNQGFRLADRSGFAEMEKECGIMLNCRSVRPASVR